MTKQYYFVSGLPRSGSTLLSSIFKVERKFILPDYVLEQYGNKAFWREGPFKYG